MLDEMQARKTGIVKDCSLPERVICRNILHLHTAPLRPSLASVYAINKFVQERLVLTVAQLYRPTGAAQRWDLGYLGTYSADRQPALERLLLQVADRLPQRRFVVAGAQFPADIPWPANVERIAHLPPRLACGFLFQPCVDTEHNPRRYGARWFQPQRAPVRGHRMRRTSISDHWQGLSDVFEPGAEMLVAHSASDVVAALDMSQAQQAAIAEAGRRRTLAEHTGERRAQSLEHLLQTYLKKPQVRVEAV